jgi:hypothetical protein
MDGIDKDATLYPQFNPALVDAMQAETGTFADRVIRGGDGKLGTLFTASFSYPTAPLFALYGVAQPAGFKAGDQVMLDPKQRGGLLTQAAFLTAKAHRDQTSPVHRGLLVRENLLCQPIPSPPVNVNTTPPPVTPATTTRERFAAHEANPACGGCHVLMDPIGLGFENYGPIGEYRTMDGNSPVDPSGEIRNVPGENIDAAGTFDGAIDLGNHLAQSRRVGDCVATQWFRFSLGRMESNDDACTLQTIRAGFAASGSNVRDLLKAIVLGNAFRSVRVVGGSSP